MLKIIYSLSLNNKFYITPSKFQTRVWRQNQVWYKDGKQNECEKYQKKLIEKITKDEFVKSSKRINSYTKQLCNVNFPLKNKDGFEWTENFDGYLKNNKDDYYFNLKIICNSGGAQIRYMRNVYYFTSNQLQHLSKYENLNKNVYFINILDGDQCYKHIDKFNFLINKPEFKSVKENIFVGDMSEFQEYWHKYNF
tara:strand:- start:3636 stop:4220 length:585 start_codon:yes stop_codon:yes gene_type:complete